VWVVGDREGGNGRFETLAEHWNGHRWSVVSTPVSTSASVMLEGMAVSGGQVWVDGEADSPDAGRPVIEHLQNGHWSTANLTGVGSIWTMLYGIAVTGDTVDGHWSVDPAPNPGWGSNILEGVTTVGGQLWTAGVYDTGGSRLPLIEHRWRPGAPAAVTARGGRAEGRDGHDRAVWRSGGPAAC
jgi:hypothetical protein